MIFQFLHVCFHHQSVQGWSILKLHSHGQLLVLSSLHQSPLGPLQFLMVISTCFFRRQAWEYFIFVLVRLSWMVSLENLLLGQVMSVLKLSFQTQQLHMPGISDHLIIYIIMVSPLLTLTGDSQYFTLGGGVLYHPSSGWVSIAVGQDPSHLDNDVTQYMHHSPLKYMASSLSCITICLCLSELPPSV